MSSPDTTVNLGNVQFSGLEVPERIPYATSQALVIHKLVGGARIIDAMGTDYAPLTWTGLLFGNGAQDRADTLEELAAGGLAQTLTWGSKNFSVIVKTFQADYQRYYQIPYTITCEVISDNARPIPFIAVPSTADQLDSDAESALSIILELLLLTLTNDTEQAILNIQNTIESFITQIAALADLITTPQSALIALLQPILGAQSSISTLIQSSDVQIADLPGFAGVIAGGNPVTMASDLENAQSAAQAEAYLLSLQGLVGRIITNVDALYASPNTQTYINPNLFTIAAAAYGDATQWNAIAQSNALTDPMPQGALTLVIPLEAGDNGGVLAS